MKTSAYQRATMKTVSGIVISLAVLLVVGVAVLELFSRFPLETLIFGTVIAIAVLGMVLYIWELTLIGWVVDFLSAIGLPAIQAKPAPLEYEQVGEIIVVTLRENIATLAQCQFVEKQLKHLVDEHHSNFVLDFHHAGRISSAFRKVLMQLLKAARNEARKLGKADRPVVFSNGDLFRAFDDKGRAVEEMVRHRGHGWVVLSAVPVGIRAVSDLVRTPD